MSFRSRLATRPAALLAAGGVLALAVGGFAMAAIPSADGTIHGCYTSGSRGTGDLRVLDPAKTSCGAGETAISWSKEGRPGPPGPTGPPPDLSGVLGSLSAVEVSIGALATRVAKLQGEQVPELRMTYAPSHGRVDLEGVGLQPGAEVTFNLIGTGQPSTFPAPGTVAPDGTYAQNFPAYSGPGLCVSFQEFYLTSITEDGDPIESNHLGPDCQPV